MKAIILPILAFLFLSTSGFGQVLSSNMNPAPNAKFKVGVVVPLTAASSLIGECVRNSVILAKEQLDKENRIEFIFEDDGLQAAKTVPAVQKLIESDKVQALIIYGTPTSLSVNRIAEEHEIPMIGLSIIDKVVQGKSYVVKHWVPSRRLNEKIVGEVKRRGYKKVAIVSALNDAMLALRDHFRESNPVEIIMDEEVPITEMDFRPLAGKIRALKPDAVYILVWPPQPGIFSKTLRRAGYKGAFFGAHNVASMQEVAVSEGSLEGTWFAFGDNSKSGAYIESYKKRFNLEPVIGGQDGYDSAALMIEGIKGGDLNRYLHTVKDFHGSYGVYSATGQNDFDIPATLRTISGNSFKIVEER